jgi:hypothetical protein
MRNLKKYGLYILTLAVLSAGCKKLEDFGDSNVDPTRVSAASTKALLTYSMQRTQESIGGGLGFTGLANGGPIFSQHLSEGPYLTFTPFNGSAILNPSYYTAYSEILKNLNQIIIFNNAGGREAEANGSKNNQIAVARIMKAMVYWKLTDRWGDLPYTEALNSEINAPKFDTQEFIYKDILKELTEAAAQIDGGTPVVGDIILNGDMEGWKRFAATQRLLMALRLSKVYPGPADFAATEFKAALAAGPIASGQDITYKFLAGDANNQNQWYRNYTISLRNDYAVSKTLVDYMTYSATNKDPRLPVYAEVLSSGNVVGLPFGITVQTNIPNAYSRIGQRYRNETSPAYIFTTAQVEFAQAEAAKIGWIPGGDAVAKLHYDAGIDASLTQAGVTDVAFKSTPEIAYNPATALQQIGLQRWIALYLNGWEAWSEWRRTGYPALAPGPNTQNGTNIPRRVGYPTADINTNNANYLSALSQQGWTNNSINNRMWWDKP